MQRRQTLRTRAALLLGSLATGLALVLGGTVGATAASADPVPVPADTATGSISGAMVSSTGTPVAGVVWFALPSGNVTHTATPDTEGDYSADLEPGTYTVLFKPDPVSSAEAPFGYNIRLYPDTIDDAEATRFTVEPGGSITGVDSSLHPAGRVSGIVHGPGSYWVLLSEDGSTPDYPLDGYHFVTGVADDGTWSINVPAGSYQPVLYEVVDGNQMVPLQEFGGTISVQSAVATPAVDTTAQASGTLELFLTDPSGEPVADMDATLWNPAPDGVSRHATTDADGHAVVHGLAPGSWNVSVNPMAGESAFSPVYVRGLPIVSGVTTELHSSLGTPLPAGWTATPSQTTADGVLLVDRAPLTLTVPAAEGLVGVSYIVSDDTEGPAPLTGDFTQAADGSWTATLDLTDVVGKVSIGVTRTTDRGTTAQTILPVAVPLAIGAADLTAATRGDVTSPASATAGGSTTVSGLEPGEWYYAWWFSSPTASGWAQADASGTVTTIVPSALPAGEHAVAMVSEFSELVGWAPVTVAAAGGSGGGGVSASDAAGAGASRLAATGVDPAGAITASVIVLLLGAALLGAGRARRARTR